MFSDPCQWDAHNVVSLVIEEVMPLPPAALAYVADPQRACSVPGHHRPHLRDAGTLTWGLGETSIDSISGERSNAVSSDVVSLVRGAATTASFSVRHQQATAAQPVHVVITADGDRITRELTTPEWTTIEVPLKNGVRTWLRGAHRLDAMFSIAGGEWKRPN